MAPENQFPGMSDESRVLLLTERVKNLTGEVKELKERLDREARELREAHAKADEEVNKKIAKLETAYQRGFGMFLVFPLLGATIGFIATYWNTIFKPLTK